RHRLITLPVFYCGIWAVLIGVTIYFVAIGLSILRLLLIRQELLVDSIAKLLWTSGFPTTIGIVLIGIDLFLLLPRKRRRAGRKLPELSPESSITVVLTAYNDELSIADCVRDFQAHPRVKRVIVVSNNSTDQTMARAKEAGAITLNEEAQGYGRCVYRCLVSA